MDSRQDVLVALGANLPWQGAPPEVTLSRALTVLAGGPLRLRALARFYRTPCFPAGAGPDYVNGAVRLAAPEALAPAEILAELHRIEALFGRHRETRWGMRTLDLDLIAVGQRLLPDRAGWAAWRDLPPSEQARLAPDELILPHPRLADRAFVIVPLADVAPDWRHPVEGRNLAEMRAALPAEARAEIRAM
ncbi:2-amino-4-hydroxy-6-hydroxymethyldihydropteridine diphosphokinase [Roseivivax sp.]